MVLSAVRHGCNLDYDALQDLANNHRKLREMMGLGDMDIKQYSRSAIQENIAKVSVETIEKISNRVIGEGHAISPKAIERVRGDSFVVQTNVHHPTDANLILDGITKILILVSRLAPIFSIVGWRKHEYHRCEAKKLTRSIQRAVSSKKQNKDKRPKALYQELIEFALQITDRCKDTIAAAKKCRRKKNIISKYDYC